MSHAEGNGVRQGYGLMRPVQARPTCSHRLRVVGAAIAALVLGCVPGCSHASTGGEGDRAPSWSPNGKRIAFVSDREGDDRLYVVNANGGEPRVLAEDAVAEFAPQWSPDGKSIAFISDRDGNWELYVMQADGGHVRRLTRSPRDDHSPRWSPDGSRIVFVREGVELASSELYSATPAGKLTRLTRNRVGDHSPAWSPDGRRIAFAHGGLLEAQIVVMDVSNGDFIRATKNALDSAVPDWAPGGTELAFVEIANLVVVAADGSRRRGFPNLVARDLIVNTPKWSPDGRRILFSEGPFDTASRDNSRLRELYVVNVDGRGLRRLTQNQVWDGGAEWSPDGRRIVFESDRAEDRTGLYVMNSRGAGIRRLVEPAG